MSIADKKMKISRETETLIDAVCTSSESLPGSLEDFVDLLCGRGADASGLVQRVEGERSLAYLALQLHEDIDAAVALLDAGSLLLTEHQVQQIAGSSERDAREARHSIEVVLDAIVESDNVYAQTAAQEGEWLKLQDHCNTIAMTIRTEHPGAFDAFFAHPNAIPVFSIAGEAGHPNVGFMEFLVADAPIEKQTFDIILAHPDGEAFVSWALDNRLDDFRSHVRDPLCLIKPEWSGTAACTAFHHGLFKGREAEVAQRLDDESQRFGNPSWMGFRRDINAFLAQHAVSRRQGNPLLRNL